MDFGFLFGSVRCFSKLNLLRWSNILTRSQSRRKLSRHLSHSSRHLHDNSSHGESFEERVSRLIAGSEQIRSVNKQTVKYNPVKSTTQADWISWLTKQNDYDRYFEDYFSERELQKLQERQEFSPSNITVFGSELAPARFVVGMMGRVKLYNDDHWYSKYTTKTNPLPSERTPGLRVEAVDLSNTDIVYEGLENLFSTQSVLYLSLANCNRLDEWAISRLAMIRSLVSLDLSGNQFITERCLIPLHHLPNLRKLNLGGIKYFENQPLALLMLEEMLPDCVLVNVPDALEKTETPFTSPES